MKCAIGYELLVGLILFDIISHVALLALIHVSAESRLANPVLRTSSFLIATWS
jgi:hypothetical protein